MTFEELLTATETATAEETVHLLYNYFKTWNPDLLATAEKAED